MKKKKHRSFAGRLTWVILFWLFFLMGLLTLGINWFTQLSTNSFYAESYHNSMLATLEYTRRVLSDVYVAVDNNTYYIEQNLDKPDKLKDIMERMVRGNSRIRSCGISFVENYYPKKGRSFCPYAWRSSDDYEHVQKSDLETDTLDYLNSEWFKNVIETDSAQWSSPFFDGYDYKKPLVAYMVPIHGKNGRTVAVMGADISLDWLNEKLRLTDSIIAEKAFFGGIHSGKGIKSFIVRRDGTYVTHPDEARILKDNFFSHIEKYESSWLFPYDSDLDSLTKEIHKGIESKYEGSSMFLIDGHDTYVFYAPVKYLDWMVVTTVRRISIDLAGIIINFILLSFVCVAVLVIVLVFFFAVRSLVKPLHKLAVSADELAKGNFNVQLPIIKKDDEIGRLRDSFENMQESLKKYIEDLKEATAVTAVIENELKIAHAIQMAMLPHFFTDNPGRSDVGIFGSLTPAKAVGGDLFDFVFRDDKLYFCIADVSGKGIPASLVMAVTRSLFRAVLSRVEGPAKIAASLNDVISDGNENNMFVTFFVGELDLKTGVLGFCNAGHNAPFLITSDVEMLVVESNLPLGVMQDWNFLEQQITIQPGTSMFLYTDGLNEAENAEHGQFGDERAISVLRQCVASHLDNPRQLIEQMTAAVHDFVGDAEQSDDMTMLSIKMNNLKK